MNKTYGNPTVSSAQAPNVYSESINGKKVVFKPVWKWLIEEDQNEGRKKP